MTTELNFQTIIEELSCHGKGLGNGEGMIGHTAIRSYLRHDHPVLGVDQIIDHSFNEGWLHAIRAISCSQPVFQGHFRDAAIYPGTSLCQDILQLAILLVIGMTGPLKAAGTTDQEMTVVSDIVAYFGHPIPPGSLLDIAVWNANTDKKRAMRLSFEARMRGFDYYSKDNRYGIRFRAALSGGSTITRVKRRIYEGIGI